MPCFALAILNTPLIGQTVTPDLFNPTRSSLAAPPDSALRKSLAGVTDPPAEPNALDTSRIGQLPSYGLPAASGAAVAGYDSLNRKRKKPKYYPGQAKPKPSPGPGTPPPPVPVPLPPTTPPSRTANKTPIPPAMAGTVVGQPLRKRLRIDDDPFGAVGDYAGSFLIKSAVEVGAGYDTNPGRLAPPQGLPFWVVAPEFLAVSDWERHALVADLRGAFTGYGRDLTPPANGTPLASPLDLDRPNFIGHVDGRFDVSGDTHLVGQGRLLVATDNPGSPNVQAGLARFPLYSTVGATLGLDQGFNRLQVSGGGTVDRTDYQWSKLTDGTMTSNDDRNFSQFGGVGRVSYELTPAVKPFVEAEADSRFHDLYLDRNGYARNSNGGYIKGGSSFEFTRLLFGEASIGYAARTYADPRLSKIDGFLTTGSLIWKPTGLTTARFITDTQILETTIPGASGILTHSYTVEVDHDLRRWLTVIGRFSWGTLDYVGVSRFDRTYTLSGDIIYKLTRSLWLKATVRRDLLDSTAPGASSSSTVVMLGLRVQN